MEAELLFNITPSETRVAYIERDILQEVHIERKAFRSIVGNIYKGRVSRVLVGMQAVFIDIGLEKAAFLHFSDIVAHMKCITSYEKRRFIVQDISELVYQGQDLIVQVVKDPRGTKGARLTMNITLSSSYLIFIPGSSYLGVSQRIESKVERKRLKVIVANYCDELGSYIIRTAAEGVGEDKLTSDAAFLKRLWMKVIERKKRNQTRCRLYSEVILSQRILRDFAGAPLDCIRIDSLFSFKNMVEFTRQYIPEMTAKLELYSSKKPIFDLFNVEKEIQILLARKVELKSGGYLIIDETETMTTIDVNTGAFVGYHNLDKTTLNTNIEATLAIAKQLRLRNVGGIIVIDFINMMHEDHRQCVLYSLNKELSKDRVKTVVNGFSQLGLVEMTRKRTRESIEHILRQDCAVCKGHGRLKTVETVCYEIIREVMRIHYAHDFDHFLVYASLAVSEALKVNEYHALEITEIFVNKRVEVQIQPLYTQEQFDIVVI